MKGVYRTRVGYAGGSLENPSYRNLGDHTETIQLDFDPAQFTYEEILQLYWDNHNPAAKPWSRQYMSIIFYHDDEQRNKALESMKAVENRLGVTIYTELLPFSEFYLAEDYHQKYYLQGEPELANEIESYYQHKSGFVNSTAAARLNGLIAGYGDAELLAEELESYGLTPESRELLLRVFN